MNMMSIINDIDDRMSAIAIRMECSMVHVLSQLFLNNYSAVGRLR